VTGLDRSHAFGRGYRYAHDQPDALVDQEHLPGQLAGRRYYSPTDHGEERSIAARLREVREELERRRGGGQS
jgi:putative ATPase